MHDEQVAAMPQAVARGRGTPIAVERSTKTVAPKAQPGSKATFGQKGPDATVQSAAASACQLLTVGRADGGRSARV
jgi:hypothetical protein